MNDPAERDGCGCGQNVERCVHFNGFVVCLSSFRAAPERLLSHATGWAAFTVWRYRAGLEVKNCFCGCDITFPHPLSDAQHMSFNTEAEALEAFYAAEAELLEAGR